MQPCIPPTRSIKQSVNRPTNQSIDQFIYLSIDRSIDQSIGQSIKQTNQINRSNQSINSIDQIILCQTLELLALHLGTWACHVAFPELAHLPLVHLKRFTKTCPVEKFRRQARQLHEAVERNMRAVGVARDRVTFSPADLEAVKTFMQVCSSVLSEGCTLLCMAL